MFRKELDNDFLGLDWGDGEQRPDIGPGIAENEVVGQRQPADVNSPALAKYATDLTLLALQGKLETSRDRDADVARVIASLSNAAKEPVVVSESDLDRDAIARGVAIKVAFGDVPDSLRDKRVFRLSLDALAKGARTSDEFAARQPHSSEGWIELRGQFQLLSEDCRTRWAVPGLRDRGAPEHRDQQ